MPQRHKWRLSGRPVKTSRSPRPALRFPAPSYDTPCQRSAGRPAGPHSAAAAYGLLGVVVCFWGVNWPLMKIGLAWLPPFWFTFLRLGLGAALAVWAVISINRALPAVTTSLAMLGVPAGGLLLSAVVLGESVTVSLLLGLMLIVGGVAIVAWSDRRESFAATGA